MPDTPSPFRFLSSTPVKVVTAMLVVQCVVLFAVSRLEVLPDAPPLSTFPTAFANWRLIQEGYVDEDTREVLKADDLLSRTYARAADRAPTNLFIAAFRSQRTGKAPHSPKNCLPGAGWTSESAGTAMINIPGNNPIEVNRYIVAKGDSRSVVMYWYQSERRVVADEFKAKVYVVMDSMRYNRTDTALVRIVAPVLNGDNDAAIKNATDFVIDAYPLIKSALPN